MKDRFYQRFTATIVAALALTAVFALTAFADVPTQGTVVEGFSIPGGITLNSSRADVEAVLGNHQFCQLPNQNLCNYSQGIQVTYEDVPQSSNNSIVRISFNTTVQWRTTVGASLQLLIDNAASVAALYPGAQIQGNINAANPSVEINVPASGINFVRTVYRSNAFASATIFRPSGGNPAPQPPAPNPALVVTLYDGKGFTQGKKGSFEFGIGTVAGKGNLGGAKKATSVRVPDGLRVTLCSNKKGTKNCQTLTEDKRRLQRGLRNKVRFVQVTDSSQALSAAALNSVQTAENFELLYLPTMVQQ